jgi:UDP-N-acetylglucosamine 4,6-dehydratase/5-epimerase
VANSRGSVIPVLIEGIINKKPITITDPNITRFLITIPDAVKLIFKATQYSQGGDIFILKMRAFRLGVLLDVLLERIAPKLGISEKVEVDIIGAIEGEKYHEDLINLIESRHVFDLEDMYLVLKDINKGVLYPNASRIKLDHYTSDMVELIGKDELEKIIDLYIKER